jgi:hypothetical protein
MRFTLIGCACFILFGCPVIYAHIPTQLETVIYRQHLDAWASPKCLSIPEGGFVYYYHPTVGAWLEQPFTAALLKSIEDQLKPSLEIPFTKEGFTQAVARPVGDPFGEVSYSAIWVRDCCWHYYGLKIHHPENAAKLILNLLRFYSTDEQISRFLAVIEKPQIADPNLDPMAHMNVPLIRFSSQTLSHHQFENQLQEWNHLQFDSHGLFLLALSDALSSGILLPESLSQRNFALLALFPPFFTQTKYAGKGDAGPWEERLQYNASSAGLVASGIKRIWEVLHSNSILNQGLQGGIQRLKKDVASGHLIDKIESALMPENVQNLYQCGMDRVERNLRFGGEAPGLGTGGIDRRADAALLFLALVEHTPFFDHPKRIQEILNINSSLVGPYGIYRYLYDPYQTYNYWIDFDVSSPIFGAKSALFQSVDWWKKGYMPHRQPHDAQWFFDSCFADLYYHLSMMEEESLAKGYYLLHGDIHLKRALAQLTGLNAYAANGEPLEALELPESINTVFDCFYSTRPLPSPISPLSWAKASMQMALTRARAAHAQFEGNSQHPMPDMRTEGTK